MKWFVHSSLNPVGYDSYETFEAEDEAEAEDLAWEIAHNNALSYFSVIDEDEVDEYEANGEEYMNTFIFYNDINCSAEPYDEEKHAGKL